MLTVIFSTLEHEVYRDLRDQRPSAEVGTDPVWWAKEALQIEENNRGHQRARYRAATSSMEKGMESPRMT